MTKEKGDKKTDKNSKLGRKTKYDKKKIKEILEFKRQNYTNAAICKLWRIHPDTFYEWLKKHTDFSDAYQKGMESGYKSISELARSSLYKKIAGYEYTETKELKKDTFRGPETEKQTITKHAQADTSAIIFALCNLDKSNFSRNPAPNNELDMQIVETKYTRIVNKIDE